MLVLVNGTSLGRIDRQFLGLRRPWRFSEKAVGAACWNVHYPLFRTVTFDMKRNIKEKYIEGD